MKRAEGNRVQLRNLLQARPFRRFVIVLESGDRAVIDGSENVAYDINRGGRNRFHVVTGRLTLISILDAVTGLIFVDVDANVAA